MKPVTVLHLVHRLTFGGAERVLVNVINGTGARMRHVVLSFLPADDFAAEILPGRATVLSADKRPGNDWSLPGRIAAICREHRVDVVHSQGWATFAEGVAGSLLARPRPCFVYAFRGKTFQDVQGVPLRRRVAQRLLARCCDAMLTPCNEMRRDLAETVGLSPDRVEVIYNGVDSELYRPGRNAAGRRMFGFGAGAVVVGCVARFDPVKNLLSLVRAVADCHRAFPQLRLLLVGDGDERPAIEREIKAAGLEGSAVITGRRSDVNRCLQAMDIYVQPSLYEGVSNTVLEAMSSGLAVLAGDVGGTAEIVVHGETGLLLRSTSADALGGALASLLSDRAALARMGAAGRHRVEERFSLKVMAAEYESLFRRVAGLAGNEPITHGEPDRCVE